MINPHHDATLARGRPGSQPPRTDGTHHAKQGRPHQDLSGADRSPPRPAPGWQRRGRRRPPGHHLPAGGSAVVLRDGSAVLIRQLSATDAPLLADIFAGLSAASRWMRFLAAKNHLTDAELRYLTNVDHHDHEALAALDPGGHGVGVARYIRHPHDPQAAEIAIAVVDDWHRRGLGTHLLTHLSLRARRAGIHRFTALTATGNTAMTGLLHTLGAGLIHNDGDTKEYEISLTLRRERTLHDGKAE
jgi:RimJ/RimL family protein N-acetyltransferase